MNEAAKRMEGQPKTVILVPCYNEECTVEKVVEDFRRVMPHADVYVYDNNSTDRTAELAEAAGAIVGHEPKQGKGNVVRAMLRDIDADCYIIVDGDDTYPAEDAPALERAVLEGGYDMAVGDRLSSTYFSENKRAFHGFGNKLVRSLVNRLFGAGLHDIMTGYRAFSYDFAKSYAVVSRGFEIETEMTIFALDNNMGVVEMPVGYRDRPEGSESKLDTYSDGARVLKTVFRLFRDTKPLAFFTVLALVIALVGLIFFIPILADFVTSGTVAKIPTLVMVSGVFVAALICFFSGVVLSVLKKSRRQEFENHLTLMRLLYPRGE